MLTRLVLTNYRAFKNQEFRFKRLNIFVGKNNSGKSSAISALNVLAQTVKNNSFESTPLLLNGEFDKLGTFIDVVHGNHPRRKIGIEVEFGLNCIKTEFKYRTQRREIELTGFELLKAGKQVIKFQQLKDSYDLLAFGTPIERIAQDLPKRRPSFNYFWPRRILPPSLITRQESNKAAYETLSQVDRELFLAQRDFERHFTAFDSLSPFRDRPERTYLYSGETSEQVGITGSNAAVMLSSDAARRGSQRKNLLEGISKWFEYTGIAKGLSVVSLTPRHFEICLVSNDGSQHNICDVGFGCSQVLPVLTAGLNLFSEQRSAYSSRRVLIVQEPEIHLHPNAQAAMGSFFVSLIQQAGQIFIETHSDNLVLRIARHVALGDIDPDEVAIFYVSEDAEKRVTEIEMTATGTFKPEFPEGFFPQRQAESLMLARAAMNKREGRQTQMAFEYPEVTR